METKEERMIMLPSPSSETHAVEQYCSRPSGDDSDTFYIKLADLLDPSGLTLIFNVRETLLDLYLFYLEVTRRGGYHQVGREKKWGEVIFALKLEGNSVKLCAQVEKLYAHLLFQFEQLYFYRHPAKQRRSNSAQDGQKATEMSKDCPCHMIAGAGYVEQPVLLLPPSNVKESKKRRGSLPGRKTAYQIFIKQECARLKTCTQVTNGKKILRLALDTWRNMSEIEKQPYVEESMKNKEEVKEAMISHNKQQRTQETREDKWPSMCGDYLVTSQPETKNSLVNQATIGLALKMSEKAPKDPSFLMDWGAYYSLDFPTRESE